jgi:hypothetical protein
MDEKEFDLTTKRPKGRKGKLQQKQSKRRKKGLNPCSENWRID